MTYKDLREWLECVDELGELRRIDGANWDLETGGLVDMVYREAKDIPPAILFDHISDYPAGFRQLFGMLGSLKRVAMAMGMPLDYPSLMDFVQAYREKTREVKLAPPRFVDTGPIMEKVYTGPDVNLYKLPTPRMHELDGGRYLGTAHLVITQDPDTGWVNVGTYRMMLHDDKTLGWYMSPGRHGGFHRGKYFARNQSCPVAVVMGSDPLLWLLSTVEIPEGVSEYDYAGGLRGTPVEVIKAPITGLPIPANAEIVLEGYSPPDERRPEGPFGEWTGYYGSAQRPEPVMKVQAIYHRSSPILSCATSNRPPSDCNFHMALVRSALLWDDLEKAGVPDVKGVWRHPSGCPYLLTIVSIKQRYAGHARQAALIANQSRAGAYMGRFVIVVDDDIDPTNTNEVLWALSTRTDPASDIDFIRKAWGSPLDPLMTKAAKESKAFYNSRAIIDACKPFDWIEDFPPVVQTSPELRKQIMSKFGPELFS